MEDIFAVTAAKKIHIRTQTMGRKCITTIDGLDEDLDLERIARAMKRAFHSSTKVTTNKEGAEIILLQGDKSDVIRAWLIESQILTETEAAARLVNHGV
jgi:translation initiation factor 1